MASAISSGGRIIVSSLCPRLISMVYSLRLRLIVLFMLVVMVAVGTVALVASKAAASNLQVYVQTDAVQQILSTLLNAYRQHQSQQALQALTEQLARSSHQRIILFDHQRRVIADSDHTLMGQVLPETILPSTTFSTSPSAPSPSVNPSSSPSSPLNISTHSLIQSPT